MSTLKFTPSQQNSQRYIDAADDVFKSGILASLSARPGQVLLMLASYSVQDTRHFRYRTVYADHDTWAESFGVSRSRMTTYFNQLERAGVIVKVGKRQRNHRYQIADFEDLQAIAGQTQRPKQNSTGNGNLKPGPPVRESEQLATEEVFGFSNSNMSGFSNSKPQEVFGFSNTEVAVRSEDVKEEEGLDISLSRNGENGNGNSLDEIELVADSRFSHIFDGLERKRADRYWVGRLKTANGDFGSLFREALQDLDIEMPLFGPTESKAAALTRLVERIERRNGGRL